MVIAKKKKKIRYKNAAVYFYNKEHNAILVHQRAKAEKKFPYTILTPGGKKEKTDKNIKETAIREIREETGIEIKEDELVEIGSTNTTKYFLVYFDPTTHRVDETINIDEILMWTLSDVGTDAGDGKHRWLSWKNLIECKQNPRMHPTNPEDNLGYLHPALLNKFQGGVWNLRRQGIFENEVDVNMFNTKDLKKEVDSLKDEIEDYNAKIDIIAKEYNKKKQKLIKIELLTMCNIVPQDLLNITNFKFENYFRHHGDDYPVFDRKSGMFLISYNHNFNSYYLSLILKNKPSIHNHFPDDVRKIINSFMGCETIVYHNIYDSRDFDHCYNYYPNECWYYEIDCTNHFFSNPNFNIDESADEVMWKGKEHYAGTDSCTYLINKILYGINGEYEKIMKLNDDF